MKKLACQAAAALAAAALLMTAPLGTVYASDTAAAASDVDFNALMAEVADSAGNAEDVQKAAEEAYNASMAIGNSAEISGIIANQTIVNLAFGRADSEEEIQNAAAAAQLLEQQSSAAAQRIASAAEAAAASADTAKSAAEEAAASAKETASAAASTEVSDSDRKLLAAIIYGQPVHAGKDRGRKCRPEPREQQEVSEHHLQGHLSEGPVHPGGLRVA